MENHFHEIARARQTLNENSKELKVSVIIVRFKDEKFTVCLIMKINRQLDINVRKQIVISIIVGMVKFH